MSLSELDETPIPYELTDLGWATAPVQTLTAAEAAVRVGMTKSQISRLARLGEVEAVKVDEYWLIDGASVAAYAARRRVPPPTSWVACPRLPAGPLLRQIELRGGVAACGVAPDSAEEKAIERAREEGSLTLWAADHMAVRVLGMTPLELWGGAWDV